MAQFKLGGLYEYGHGVPQDFEEAVRWYRLAAEQGLAFAQVNLGLMYEGGRGVPLDLQEAAKWHRLAAEQGRPTAQFMLAVKYRYGSGVPQDFVQAHKWANLAAANTDNKEDQTAAMGLRDEVASQMTTEQIAEAQQLAREQAARNLND